MSGSYCFSCGRDVADYTDHREECVWKARDELDSVRAENVKLKHLLRQLFYARFGMGQKVEELIAESNQPLWKQIFEVLEGER